MLNDMLTCWELESNKNRIKESFSSAVNTYDCSSDIQSYVADILFQRISCLNFPYGPILEFGCGTGLLTKKLLCFFQKRDIFSFDLSFNMCKKAKENIQVLDKSINFLVADAEYPCLVSNYFSAIFSNSSFQWINSPKDTLRSFKELLVPRGVIVISTFGPNTLKELSYSLSIYLNKKVLIAASNFLNKKQLIKYFSSNFKSVKIQEIVITKKYPDLFSLLKSLKDTGSNIKTSQLSSFILTKKKLNLINKIYKKEFGEIIASYQVFLCEAQR